MEKNFNTDNFEQLLRETTDEFRMYPSKRVWHSLYNDLHPGRKWPSVAILLLLITMIMYIGVTNTTQSLMSGNSKSNIARTSITLEPVSATAGMQATPVAIIETSLAEDIKAATDISEATTNSQTILQTKTSVKITTLKNNQPASLQSENTDPVNAAPLSYNVLKPVADASLTLTNESAYTNTSDSEEPAYNSAAAFITTVAGPVDKKPLSSAKEKMSKDDKEWIEDDILHNKKIKGQWKNRMAYQVYVTPSVGYRSFKKNTNATIPVTPSLIANPSQVNDLIYSLNHSSSLNFEGGTNFIYSFTKDVRLKAGVQFNFTNYRINAYGLNHPTLTTLMLNDPYGYPVLSARTTTLANTPGPASRNLNNNTFQLSLPIGADIKITGNNRLKWYAGATIQPTYVTGGNAFLISSDLKNYVTEEDLMRKININAGIETFLSYKTNSGVVLSAGPQFRYQFLSTYSKEYTYDEKLYNIGVKLGITRNF